MWLMQTLNGLCSIMQAWPGGHNRRGSDKLPGVLLASELPAHNALVKPQQVNLQIRTEPRA